MIFSAYSTWVLVVNKAVTLHWWMNFRRTRSWVQIKSFFIRLLWIFKSVVCFPKRHTGLSLLVSLLHLLLVQFDSIASIDNGPIHSYMLWGKIRVCSELQRSLVESILTLFGLLTTAVPSLCCILEFLLDNRRAVSTLWSVSIDVNIAHDWNVFYKTI